MFLTGACYLGLPNFKNCSCRKCLPMWNFHLKCLKFMRTTSTRLNTHYCVLLEWFMIIYFAVMCIFKLLNFSKLNLLIVFFQVYLLFMLLAQATTAIDDNNDAKQSRMACRFQLNWMSKVLHLCYICFILKVLIEAKKEVIKVINKLWHLNQ